MGFGLLGLIGGMKVMGRRRKSKKSEGIGGA
jgi:hypothetical protein